MNEPEWKAEKARLIAKCNRLRRKLVRERECSASKLHPWEADRRVSDLVSHASANTIRECMALRDEVRDAKNALAMSQADVRMLESAAAMVNAARKAMGSVLSNRTPQFNEDLTGVVRALGMSWP